MKNRMLRKLLVILVMIVPVFAGTDCKKQPKCGCDGDMLFDLKREQARVYFNPNSNIIYFTPVVNPYSTYYICAPSSILPKLKDSKSGDILLVSGNAYWNCSFLQQSSNYSYSYSMYKMYDFQVTDIGADLYGK